VPSWLDVIGALIGAVFGAGVAWGAFRGRLKTAEERASTAIQQTDTFLGKLSALELTVANDRTDRVRLEGKLERLERESQLREEFRQQNAVLDVQTAYLDAIARRTGSVPSMTAARPIPRQEPPSSPIPPPPMRPRLGSRRGE
jgi:hypothetical protein